ncbi:sensor histidine kinase [Marinobacter adhaerens]|uniref:sensor histidine kinase n=1 Tax=Marinobacter adhaerens TaxID=1033846 RepID=UPI001E49651D|nr:HAMP domain-containing sensor histidine kinase [Marinobacter adhaerens]MCD1645777.1 HAMP domain-containing histidine kinase [Marinobacter adhaerens]
MKLLSGMDQIRQLPAYRQRRFERFYHTQYRSRVLPLFADVYLAIAFIGTLLFLGGLALNPDAPDVFGIYLIYTAILSGLIVAHRFTRLRRAAPTIVYLVFFNMAAFSYLGYMTTGASLAPIVGLFFFISSVGIITLSLLHTSLIILINLTLLVLSTFVAVDSDQVTETLIGILTNWLILMCLVVAPLSAWFLSQFLRNLLALQFLLRDRNRQLSRTLETLKSTEERLAQEQKHQALSHMAKGLLHEIMNPLNCASQAVDFASSVNRDPELADALADASTHQKRIADIVSDLIEFSRPVPEHHLETADLGKLVSTATRFCQHQLRDVELQTDIRDGTTVPCYPSALTQVFVNLLLNGVSAVSKNQRPGKIEITAETSDSAHRIMIRDNGQGIAPDDIKRLTDPFYSTSDTPDNLGLGLSICQTIMRHHKGNMSITSEPGQWTQVTLTLPRTAAPHAG